MREEKSGVKYTTRVSESFARRDEQCSYEVPFRRWLVREIVEGRFTVTEAVKRFNFNPANGCALIGSWRNKYGPGMVVNLPDMTEAEKQQLNKLQKQLKAAEKQLGDARMQNIALNTLIDVAEEKLHINIRKKPGAKQ